MKIEGIEVLCEDDLEKALTKMALRIMQGLKMSKKQIGMYKKTIKQDTALVMNGGKPSSIVASRVYVINLLTGGIKTQEVISREAGVSVAGILKYYPMLGVLKWRKKKSTRE